MNKLLKKLLDLLWPHFDDEPENPDAVDVLFITENISRITNETLLRHIWDICEKISKEEAERYANIIQKATLIFGFISIIMAFMTYMISIASNQYFDKLVYIAYLGYGILLVYFIQTLRECFRIIGVKKYYTMGPMDLMRAISDDSVTYFRNIIIYSLESTEKNYRVTNALVDDYNMAIKYFFCSIITMITIGAILFLAKMIN